MLSEVLQLPLMKLIHQIKIVTLQYIEIIIYIVCLLRDIS